MALEEIFVHGSTGFMKKLVSSAAKRIGKAGTVDKDLQKLKDTLEMIAAVTSDAEKKQVKDKVVLLWLRRLQDFAYDVDDLLDEISYEAMRQSQKDGNSDKVTILSAIKFSSKMAKSIKVINQELDEIAKHRVMFQLEHSFDDESVDTLDRMTHSFIGDYKIVGRDKDKSRIVEMLLTMNHSSSSSSRDSSSSENVSVVSVVGMGGVGKTTLAQLVYKDLFIERSFEPRAWVCISDEFDIFLILKNIFESITGRKCDDFSNVNVLVKKVQNEISGKKYLLVLDDLWNENAEEWEKLSSILSVGAQGSKILVTTRKETVASMVRGTISPFNLTTLCNQECWLIVKDRAFSPGGSVETLTMSIIGEEISRKCAGLPLAAHFLGNLMRLKRKESDWLAIRDSEVFNTPESPNKIILILKLSYDNLSSPLKKCFSYCSLFPKDYYFNRETLLRLWMAEGFLHSSTGGNENSLEDIGNGYFHSLLSSSFFQDFRTDDLGDITWFKMHDLVHDLALSVAGSHEVMTLKPSEIEKDVSQIRRLHLMMDGVPEIFSHVLSNAKKLRTIFFQKDTRYPSALINKRLRVVHWLGDGGWESLPSSLKFKHMRYLDLSYSNLEDVHANSISQLYNLQTLNLRHSRNVQTVLSQIGSLISLRYLDIYSSDAQVLPDSISKLTNFNALNISGCWGISVLPKDIASLQNLSSLNISFTRITELPTNIGSLQNLISLDISYTHISELPDSISLIHNLRNLNLHSSKVKVLPDSISKLANLQILNIRHTNITELPKNIGCLQNLSSLNFLETKITELPDSICCMHKLEDLELKGTILTALPQNFGALTQLTSLDLFNTKITELPESMTSNLCKLESVNLGWSCKFPKNIKNWVELRSLVYTGETDGLIMPRGVEKLTCLEELVPYIVRKEEEDTCSYNSTSSSSIHELADLNSLQKIWIRNLEIVRGGKIEAEKAKLINKQNIQDLDLRWKSEEEKEGDELDAAGAAMVLEGLQPHPNLEKLRIVGFPGLKFPKWLGLSSCLPNLVELRFYDCKGCKNLDGLGQLPCLKVLQIEGMESPKSLGEEFYYQPEEEVNKGSSEDTTTATLFPSLTNLYIVGMDKLEEWVAPSPTHISFPCLEGLDIQNCGNLTCIPDLRLWASSLRHLRILKCNKLKESIPYDLNKKSLAFLKTLSFGGFRNLMEEEE